MKGFCPYWTKKQVEKRLTLEGIGIGGGLDSNFDTDIASAGASATTVTPSFTFVREPMGHFISGLAEAYYRSRHER